MNATLLKVYMLFVVSFTLFASCGINSGPKIQDRNNEVKSTIILNDSILHQSGENNRGINKQINNNENIGTVFTIANKDTILLNDSVFHKYSESIQLEDGENEVYFGIGSTDDAKYQTQFFLPKENSDYDIGSSNSFILDSIPLWEGMYALLFSNLISGIYEEGDFFDAQGWFVIYSSEHDYIDSRLIYQEKEVHYNHKKNIYSEFCISRRKLLIFTKDFYEETFGEIPVVIHENGTLEEFPEIPFSNENFAISDCNGNGLSGKFSLKQDWTLFNFKHNKTIHVNTSHVSEDELGNTNTQLLNLDEKDVSFDIAFKGVYFGKDIEVMSPVKENDENIKHFVEQNLPAEIFIEQSDVDNINLFTIEFNQRKFWVAIVKSSDYAVLIGITPDKKVVLLANRCVYDFHLLKLKNSAMLYVENTSCGEGALGCTQLYKIETDFENVFKDVIICD